MRSLLLIGVLALSGCGIGIRRDLSAVPASRITMDDRCHLQAYFDRLQDGRTRGPRIVLSVGTGAESGASSGRDLWAFDTAFTRRTLRKVLRRNWRNLPPEVANARHLGLEVTWVERAGIRRVVSSREPVLLVGREHDSLPNHPCLSELLYGAPLYRERREMLGLPPPAGHRGDPWGLRQHE
jgi:hypothetical protein